MQECTSLDGGSGELSALTGACGIEVVASRGYGVALRQWSPCDLHGDYLVP